MSSRSFQLPREGRPAWDPGNPAPEGGSDVCSDSPQRPYFPKSCADEFLTGESAEELSKGPALGTRCVVLVCPLGRDKL